MRSHLLRYAGEFVIIFLSITFTWWFDEWRQEKADREEEAVILKNLDVNLSADSLNLNNELAFIRKSLFTFNDFLERLASGDLKETDSSGLLIRRLVTSHEFHPSKATFEAVKSTGELKLIRDDSLVQAIMNLYEVTYQELEFSETIYSQTTTLTTWNYSIENHDLLKVLANPTDRIYKFDFKSGEEKSLLINKILFARMAAGFAFARLEKSLEQVLLAKKMIGKRLGELNQH